MPRRSGLANRPAALDRGEELSLPVSVPLLAEPEDLVEVPTDLELMVKDGPDDVPVAFGKK
jgi:hypothetical protein